MSNKTNPDDAAFPSEDADNYLNGLTIREHFASLAMQGILSSPSFQGPIHQGDHASAADHAVRAANALIAALNK